MLRNNVNPAFRKLQQSARSAFSSFPQLFNERHCRTVRNDELGEDE